jgi:hypothetical protein
MNKTYFFQLNIEADNTNNGTTTHFLNVLSQMIGTYSDGRPMVSFELLAVTIDYLNIKDFRKAYYDAEQAAQNHFALLAKQKKIEEAKAFLADEKEVIDNPVLERYTDVHPFLADIISNHFTPVS